MKKIIAAFMKFPEPGTVKTRMMPEFGPEEAALAYEELAAATLSALPQTGYEIWVAFTPKNRQLGVANWIRGKVPRFMWTKLIAQCDGDLGTRMWTVVKSALVVERAASVTLIGTDCPRIKPSHFSEAQGLLDGGKDVVYGPARDGGYYLQALKVPNRELFFGIPWSHPKTLSTCMERARFLGLKAAKLETLSDVDTVADWQLWQEERQRD